MSLSDACFEFHTDVQDAAARLCEAAEWYENPPFGYGSEAPALAALGRRAAAEPIDAGEVAHLIALSSAVLRYYDTMPGDPAAESRMARMLSLSAAPHEPVSHLPALFALATGLTFATAIAPPLTLAVLLGAWVRNPLRRVSDG